MPNSKPFNFTYLVALKDISPGEELTGNYANDIKIQAESWIGKAYTKYYPFMLTLMNQQK